MVKSTGKVLRACALGKDMKGQGIEVRRRMQVLRVNHCLVWSCLMFTAGDGCQTEPRVESICKAR